MKRWKVRLICDECHRPFTDYAEDKRILILLRRYRKGICSHCIAKIEEEIKAEFK